MGFGYQLDIVYERKGVYILISVTEKLQESKIHAIVCVLQLLLASIVVGKGRNDIPWLGIQFEN